jgi:hypothetical protein
MARASVEERPDVAARVLARVISVEPPDLPLASSIPYFWYFYLPGQPFPLRLETGKFIVFDDSGLF